MVIRRILSRLPLAALALAMVSLVLAVLLQKPPSMAEPETNSIQVVKNGAMFTVGGQTYTFAIEGLAVGKPLNLPIDKRLLRERHTFIFPVYPPLQMPTLALKKPKMEESILDTTCLGEVTLTLDMTSTGTVFYLSSDVSTAINAHLTTNYDGNLTVLEAPYGTETAEDLEPVETPHWGKPYGADSGLYLEGDGVHLYLSRLATITALGHTVYYREVPDQGATFVTKEGTLSIFIPIPAGHTVFSGAATQGALINWSHEDALENIWNLSCSDVDYHLLESGVYLTMPETYRPFKRKSKAPHIYCAATAWLLGPCTYEENGPLFITLGKSIVYTYTDRVNKLGFIPTAPSSTWLTEDYGIGAGFYDTRFNFDTMKRLMRAEEVWNDPTIADCVQNMVHFYLQYAANTQFTVGESQFVPDYGRPAPKTLKGTRAACSLNHYLAEGLLLIRAGERYKMEAASELGYSILDSIDKSAAVWLRPNGDLWYAIRPDGQTEKNDYVDVTYLDLADASFLLTKLGHWDDYEGIQALLAYKEEWLIDHGYRDKLVSFPDFTAFY